MASSSPCSQSARRARSPRTTAEASATTVATPGAGRPVPARAENEAWADTACSRSCPAKRRRSCSDRSSIWVSSRRRSSEATSTWRYSRSVSATPARRAQAGQHQQQGDHAQGERHRPRSLAGHRGGGGQQRRRAPEGDRRRQPVEAGAQPTGHEQRDDQVHRRAEGAEGDERRRRQRAARDALGHQEHDVERAAQRHDHG